MEEKLKHTIENFLKEDVWKEFIDEEGNDLLNASLNSLDVTIGTSNNTHCEFYIDINYNILEEKKDTHKNGKSDFTNSENITIINVSTIE